MKTYTESSTNLHRNEGELTWEIAIKDAEAEIQRATARVARLRASIKFFRERSLAGDPFPRSGDFDASTHF